MSINVELSDTLLTLKLKMCEQDFGLSVNDCAPLYNEQGKHIGCTRKDCDHLGITTNNSATLEDLGITADTTTLKLNSDKALYESKHPDGSFYIWVSTLGSKYVRVKVKPVTTVMELKLKMQDMEGTDPNKIKLYFNKNLASSATMAECEVEQDSKIHMLL